MSNFATVRSCEGVTAVATDDDGRPLGNQLFSDEMAAQVARDQERKASIRSFHEGQLAERAANPRAGQPLGEGITFARVTPDGTELVNVEGMEIPLSVVRDHPTWGPRLSGFREAGRRA